MEIASDPRIVGAAKKGAAGGTINERLGIISALDHYQNFSPITYSTSLIYPENNYIYSRNGSRTYSDSLFYQIIQERGNIGTVPFYTTPDQKLKQNELLLFRPVLLGSSYIKNCVLVLNINVGELVEELGLSDEEYNSQFYLVNESGYIIISQNTAEIGNSLVSTKELSDFWKKPQGYWGSIFRNNSSYRLFAKKFNTNNWTFIAMTRNTELLNKSNLIKKWTLGITGLLILIWLLVLFFTLRFMYAPIEHLVHKFRKIPRIENGTKDELQELDLIVNQMVVDNRRLQKRLNEHIPFIQESVIRHLLRGELKNPEISSGIEEIPFLTMHTDFAVAIVQVDRKPDYMRKYPLKDHQLIQYALRKLVDEMFEPVTPCLTIMLDPTQIMIIVGWQSTQDEPADGKMLQIIEEFRDFVREYFQFTVSVTISRVHKGIEGIHTGYLKAIELLDHRMLLGHDVTISESTVQTPNLLSNQVLFQYQKKILESILAYEQEAALVGVDIEGG